MNTAASSDEKIMAALVHGSIFLMFLGPIVPVILWATQRKKSKYVSFHALQAMGYQALIFWLWIAIMILITVVSVVILIPLSGTLMRNTRDSAAFPFLFQIPILITIVGFMGLSFITGIAGSVLCLLGRDFRYPFLGKWLERYLSYDASPESQMVETQEDNWVAGVCHATAILQLWGVVTPLIVWFSQKERSARLRFQSMQAFVYQVIALAVYMLGMAVYMAFFVGMVFTLVIGSAMGNSQKVQGPPAFMMAAFFVIMILFWFIIAILMPVYYLLAGWAGFRVIRGHHFRYPILGKIMERRMGTSQIAEVAS
jgi:uncharacterized Tic20 family protein